MINRNALVHIIVALCIANGIFSPYLAMALQIVPALMPEVFPKTIGWVLFFSSLFVATATLLFAGVPAALYERFAGAAPESTAPMWIWLIGVMLLSLPALETIGNLL